MVTTKDPSESSTKTTVETECSRVSSSPAVPPTEEMPQPEETPQPVVIDLAERTRKVVLDVIGTIEIGPTKSEEVTGTIEIRPVKSEQEKAQDHQIQMLRLQSAIVFGGMITAACLYILIASHDPELKHQAYIGLSLVGAAGGLHLFGKTNLLG